MRSRIEHRCGDVYKPAFNPEACAIDAIIAAAVEYFAMAVDVRVAGSADAALIYASTVALRRARDVLYLASLNRAANASAEAPLRDVRQRWLKTGRMILGFLINTRWLPFGTLA